jgi:hypothetical protein
MPSEGHGWCCLRGMSYRLLLLVTAEVTPDVIAGADQVGQDERLQSQGQDRNHGGHGAELDGTNADDGCGEEGEEHGGSFHERGAEKAKAPRIRRRAGLSGGVRRFQIIEPIASPKALLVSDSRLEASKDGCSIKLNRGGTSHQSRL